MQLHAIPDSGSDDSVGHRCALITVDWVGWPVDFFEVLSSFLLSNVKKGI
jgi:hypothetical protein